MIVSNGNAGNRSWSRTAGGGPRAADSTSCCSITGDTVAMRVTRAGLSLDAEAAWVYVTKRRSQDGNRVVILGESPRDSGGGEPFPRHTHRLPWC